MVLAANDQRLQGVKVRCERQGLQWELWPADVAQRTLYCMGSYERPMQQLLRVAIRPGDTVFDIGAHVGLLACPVARILATAGGRLFAFEPAPDSAGALRRNLELNGLDEVATVENVAVSDASGTGVLHSDPAYGEGGSSLRSLYGSGDGGQDVRVVRFDEWWHANDQPAMDVVKMDVEGAEAAAIAGMTEALSARTPRLLVIEIKEHLSGRAGRSTSDTERLLSELGYRRQPPLSQLLGSAEPMPWIDENVVFTHEDADVPLDQLRTSAERGPARASRPAPRRANALPERLRATYATRIIRPRLARRDRLRWWLVYGPAGSGATVMAQIIRSNARLSAGDRPLAPPPDGPPDRSDVDHDRSQISHDILSNAALGGGTTIDLVYEHAWLQPLEFESLAGMWGPPERKIFCFREPAGFMAAASQGLTDLSLDLLRERYVESLDSYWSIGGDPFEYTVDRTISDYISLLAPLSVPPGGAFSSSDQREESLVTPEMVEAFQRFVRRLDGDAEPGNRHPDSTT